MTQDLSEIIQERLTNIVESAIVHYNKSQQESPIRRAIGSLKTEADVNGQISVVVIQAIQDRCKSYSSGSLIAINFCTIDVWDSIDCTDLALRNARSSRDNLDKFAAVYFRCSINTDMLLKSLQSDQNRATFYIRSLAMSVESVGVSESEGELTQGDSIQESHRLSGRELIDSRASDLPRLPLRAPEEWANRIAASGESPAAFIKRVYAPWIGIIQRSDIGKLDRRLYVAFAKWVQRHGLDPDLQFTDRSAALEDELVQRGIAEPSDALRQLSADQRQDPNAVRQAMRLYGAARRRSAKALLPQGD